MKQVAGVWLPDAETTFGRVLKRSRGTYQFDRIQAVLQYCQHFALAIDVGAHVGMYSRELVKHFALTIAFEPNIDCYDCLIRNVDSRVFRALNSAVGQETDIVSLDGHPNKTVGYKTIPYANKGAPVFQDYIDRWKSVSLSFLKIDAEGKEYEILLGGAGTIRRCKPLILIEEKFDDEQKASALLKSWGASLIWRKKNDFLFRW